MIMCLNVFFKNIEDLLKAKNKLKKAFKNARYVSMSVKDLDSYEIIIK